MALYCYFKTVNVLLALSGSLSSSVRSTATQYSHATDHRPAWCKYKRRFSLEVIVRDYTCLQRYLGHTVLGEELQRQREVGDWFLKFCWNMKKAEQNITSGKG